MTIPRQAVISFIIEGQLLPCDKGDATQYIYESDTRAALFDNEHGYWRCCKKMLNPKDTCKDRPISDWEYEFLSEIKILPKEKVGEVVAWVARGFK